MYKLIRLLSGDTVSLDNKEELQELLSGTVYALGYADSVEDASQRALEIITESTKYSTGEYKFKHLNVWKHPHIHDILIAITMETDEDEEEYSILSEYGVFGYVHNLDAEQCSELGYSFYKQFGDKILRVG